MQKLDTLVAEHLMERLFKPERLAAILDALSSHRAERTAALNGRLMALQRELVDAEDKLKRLYRLVEDGLTDIDELLRDRLNTLKGDRDRAKAALERAKEHSVSQIQIDPALIERAITQNTKALIVVHAYGHPAQMHRLLKIANVRDLFLIEDAAEAHGAEISGSGLAASG